MKIVKPPHEFKTDKFTVFLAGSIEMGKAIDWQKAVAENCKDLDIVFFNPRRDDWNNDWKQTLEDENFVGQVEWELEHLENCDLVAMFIDGNTKSPITLIEFGLFLDRVRTGKKKMILFCEDNFFRKGNMDVTSLFYGVDNAHSFEQFLEKIRTYIEAGK